MRPAIDDPLLSARDRADLFDEISRSISLLAM
jgi:hypothetical protein